MNIKARNKYLPTLSDFFDSIWLADWATIVYSAFTAVVLLFFWCQSESPWDVLFSRLGIVAATFLLIYIYIVCFCTCRCSDAYFSAKSSR